MPKPDRFSARDMVVVWLIAAGTLYSAAFDPSPWLLLLLFLVSIIWLVSALVRIGFGLLRRRWRRIVSIVAAPASAGLFLWGWHLTGVSADQLRLMAWKSHYLADVAEQHAGPDGIRIAIWPWRHWTGGMAGTPDYFTVLIYDNSGQIAWPPGRRTAEWDRSADAEGLRNSAIIHPEGIEDPQTFDRSVQVVHLMGHFYTFTASF